MAKSLSLFSTMQSLRHTSEEILDVRLYDCRKDKILILMPLSYISPLTELRIVGIVVSKMTLFLRHR